MKLPIIVATLLAACSFASASDAAKVYPASETFLKQKDIIEKMNRSYPAVEVDVRWEPCEMENSFYYYRGPREGQIVLCTEMESAPSAAIFFAAHEMAHAIQHQLTDGSTEQDADELAALLMIKHGYTKELLDTAVWWKKQEHQGRTGEEHPASGFRAWEIACIAVGSEAGAQGQCAALYLGLRVRWSHRLHPLWTTFD